jgi:hypothetical protein
MPSMVSWGSRRRWNQYPLPWDHLHRTWGCSAVGSRHRHRHFFYRNRTGKRDLCHFRPITCSLHQEVADDRIPPNAAVVTFPSGSLAPEDGARSEYPVYVIAHSSATGECGPEEGTHFSRHPLV